MFPVNLFPAVGCLSCLLLFLVYFHWDYCQRSITASVRLLPAFDYCQCSITASVKLLPVFDYCKRLIALGVRLLQTYVYSAVIWHYI